MREKFDTLTLEDYMTNNPIEVIEKNPVYPLPSYSVQEKLFPSHKDSTSEQGYMSRIAFFYEILTAAITGGKWNRNRNLLKSGYGHLHPDVICEDKLIDSKAIRVGGPLKLRDIQFDQYFLHQGVSIDNRKIFYSVCRYGVDKPIVSLR